MKNKIINPQNSNNNSAIINDREKIMIRIKFLQQKLLQMSFYNNSNKEYLNRSELYINLMQSLLLTKKLLKENKRIQRELCLNA